MKSSTFSVLGSTKSDEAFGGKITKKCRQFGPLEAIECNSLKLSTFTSAKDVGLVKPTEVSGAAKGKRWRPGSGESN